jgi:hypothetical protein
LEVDELRWRLDGIIVSAEESATTEPDREQRGQ